MIRCWYAKIVSLTLPISFKTIITKSDKNNDVYTLISSSKIENHVYAFL